MSKIKKKSVNRQPQVPAQKQVSDEDIKKFIFSETESKSDSKWFDESLDRANQRRELIVKDPNSDHISSEPKSYVVTFPREYYRLLYKVTGIPMKEDCFKNKPHIFARITNHLIYLRFPVGTLGRLRKLNPKNSNGVRLFMYFQFLSEKGEVSLKQFIQEAIDEMKDSKDLAELLRRFAKRFDRPYQGHLFDKV
ncbi:P63C domain-containing protein [Siphonobacter sp.]|uniref:P63C domain-containing protein n=1 Tax=Siphonobacter sp. TaxID=1869184 RepID=UPI003B3AB8A2